MKTILFINHRGSRCGVHQYGKRVYNAISRIKRFSFEYIECSGVDELFFVYSKKQPDLIIYNYFYMTLSFITPDVLKLMPKTIHVCLAHELTQKKADQFHPNGFEYVIFGDPFLVTQNPRVFPIKRLLEEYDNIKPLPSIPTIGSCGFGGAIKGYFPLINLVQETFEEAIIRINIPPNSKSDPNGHYAQSFLEKYQSQLKNPKIQLQITNKFFSHEGLLDFLAENTINVFLYDPLYTDWVSQGGISSIVDEAISVKRPLAISSSHLFRHLFDLQPSILLKFKTNGLRFFQRLRALRNSLIYDKNLQFSDLKTILANGTAPLKHLYAEWSPKNFCRRFEEILSSIEEQESGRKVINHPLNRILDDSARNEYKGAIQELFQYSPKIMKRKIPRANVQQAFVLDTVKKLSTPISKILCVGSFEDSACDTLIKQGYNIEAIDPVVNMDLETFYSLPSTRKDSYSLIFATSVIEHVENDELFFTQIRNLLIPGGYGVFTCDFDKDYKPGDFLFPGNFRFYTEADLEMRLLNLLGSCSLIDTPHWKYDRPDFEHNGKPYTFASFVFQKSEKS